MGNLQKQIFKLPINPIQFSDPIIPQENEISNPSKATLYIPRITKKPEKCPVFRT